VVTRDAVGLSFSITDYGPFRRRGAERPIALPPVRQKERATPITPFYAIRRSIPKPLRLWERLLG
jgi:hypothetical protein